MFSGEWLLDTGSSGYRSVSTRDGGTEDFRTTYSTELAGISSRVGRQIGAGPGGFDMRR